MKLITPSATLITEKDPYKKIELVGRTCYKSEDKITDESAPKFVRGLIKSDHTAMVEHQVFVFQLANDIGTIEVDGRKIDGDEVAAKWVRAFKGRTGPYLHITESWTRTFRTLISGNVRALNECNMAGPLLKVVQTIYPDLVYGNTSKSAIELANSIYPGVEQALKIVDITTLPDLTFNEISEHFNMTFRFITDRGVTHEMVRHRPSSYGQESTRYVNYKQGLNISLPTGFYEKAEEVQKEYEAAFWDAERHYIRLMELGEKAQQARGVLPTQLKTEIVMTTYMREWNHVFNLRSKGTTGAPHPDIKTVMDIAYTTALKEYPAVQRYYDFMATA